MIVPLIDSESPFIIIPASVNYDTFTRLILIERWVYSRGAEGRTRTGTGFPPLPPQDIFRSSWTF